MQTIVDPGFFISLKEIPPANPSYTSNWNANIAMKNFCVVFQNGS